MFRKLEKRILYSATPTVAVEVDNTPFLNESTDIVVTLDNTGSEIGYGPYVDVTYRANLH